jgi:uncharacterized membrane protein YecN with MAPEG domain
MKMLVIAVMDIVGTTVWMINVLAFVLAFKKRDYEKISYTLKAMVIGMLITGISTALNLLL